MTAEEILAAAHAAIFRDEDATDLPDGLRVHVGLRNSAQRALDGIVAVLDAIRTPTPGMRKVCTFETAEQTFPAMIDALKAEIAALGR